MAIEFSNEEYQLLSTLISERCQNDAVMQHQGDILRELLLKFIFGELTFNAQEIGFLQGMLLEQGEIYGSRNASTCPTFVPQKMLQLIQSTSNKLGMVLMLDTQTPNIDPSPRQEGSVSIMLDPTIV